MSWWPGGSVLGSFEHWPYTNFHELNVDWILKVMREVVSKVSELNDLVEQHSTDIADINRRIDIINNDINNLEEQMRRILSGEALDFYLTALQEWIDRNLQEMVARVVTYVFFGLTDDGRFIAYIPRSWEFIQFNTILDGDNPMYGHLTLQW